MLAILTSLPLLFLSSAFAAPASFLNDQVCIDQQCFHLDSKESRADLNKFFASNTDSETYSSFSTKQKSDLFKIEGALVNTLDSDNLDSKLLARNTLLEIHRAFTLGNEDPFPEGFEILSIPYHFVRDLFASGYIRGRPSADVNANTFKGSKSLFQSWESHGDIKSLDLAVGPKTSHPANFDFDSGVCTYLKKKTGSGTRPGFKVTCGDTTVKLKFKEIHSHPFAARILWALGYSVAPADYVPGVTIQYDRKIFSEINSRDGVHANLKIAGLKIARIHWNPKADMLDFIDHGTLKTGEKLTVADLQMRIGNEAAENEIATVTTKGAQIQLEDSKILKIGEWSFNDFDHPDDTGIRALALPLAWMGGWDFRQDNNALAIDDTTPGAPKFEFYLPDLGGVLGSARSFYFYMDTIENQKGLDHVIARNHRLARYTTIEKNKAFRNCTREDARWMLSRLNELTPDQIKAALGGAGYHGDELDHFLTILLERRTQLNQAFE